MSTPAYPVIPIDHKDDLHNMDSADQCDLVLFMAGNQFMAMPELLSEFQKQYPEIQRIAYETLPPGIELRQILTGGAYFGNRLIHIIPDVYTSVSETAIDALSAGGHIDPANARLFLHNRLTLMVQAENPREIQSVSDLGADHLRISQPNPENEDIGVHIVNMYRQVGGEVLVHRIMEEKRAEATTIYTLVHHRETPLRIAKRTVDVGPVWATEVIHARATGLLFDVVEPGEKVDQRNRINYYACRMNQAPHPENAEKFIDFITSTGAGIYRKYGFIPHDADLSKPA